MLSSIKNKIKGWVAYLVVGLITVPFALFGISEYFTGTSNIVVANIDDDEISKEAFLAEFNPQKRRLQKELAEKYSAEFDATLKRSVLSQMIDKRLLSQLAGRMSLATTAEELNAMIQTNELFADQGRFSIEKYKQLLRLNGYTPTAYESVRMNELTQNQIKYNLLESAFILPSQLHRLQQLNDQQRNFSYVLLNASDYADKVEVNQKGVKDYFDKQTKLFFEPAQVKVDFVELSLAAVAKKISVTDDELFNFYEDESARFSSEEERQAQHILLEDEQTANQVLALLTQGGDFAALALEYSQDSASKESAGDLGFFTRGVMLGAFEDRAFAMQENELSDLVKSEFGYHIIKLNKIKPSIVKPFDSVKAELTQLYTQSKAQKDLYNLTEQMANLAYESNLEELANQMDLELQTTEFFNAQASKLDAKLVNAAFSDVVYNNNENSEVLELGDDRFVVVHLKEKLAQRQKSFDEVKAEINVYLASLLAKTFIDDIAAQIAKLSVANKADAVKQLMDKNSLTWVEAGWVKRDTKKVDAAIVNKAFALSHPDSNSVYSAQSLNSQSAVVIGLSAIKTSESQTSMANLESVLLNFESNEVFINILKTLRAQAQIELFNDNL
ncbi:SurA N-terminal domain-containing protein [Candidatus Thioglobus sp.]|uniref:SurA N-terminal domain-containing protein n=1 Tax=Candidatus Thioglobus sp. TaxID=2026721 RepID=UPI003D0EACEB